MIDCRLPTADCRLPTADCKLIMKRPSLIFILLFLQVLSLGQISNMTKQKTVDSLFALLPSTKGSTKVDVLNQLALNLAPRCFDSSFRYATEAFRLSEKLNYPLGKGIATFNIGNSYYFKADIKNALTNYLSALRILEPFEPSKEIGNLLLQLGAVNQYVRNTSKVTAYYKRAVSNFTVIGDSNATMWAYVTLASSYFYKLQTLESIGSQLPTATVNALMDSALLYNGKFLDYTTRHPEDSSWMADLYNFQGLYLSVKDDSSALDYFFKGLEACSMLPDTNSRNIGEGLLHGNLGFYFFIHLHEPELAYSHGLIAVDLIKKTDRFDIYGSAILGLGGIDIDRGHYHRAEQYLHQGLNIIDTFLVKIGRIIHPDPAFRIWGITQARSFRIRVLNNLVRLYELTGDYKQALVYHKKLEEEKSIQSLDELTRQIIGLEADNED